MRNIVENKIFVNIQNYPLVVQLNLVAFVKFQFALYQSLTGEAEEKKVFKKYSEKLIEAALKNELKA